MQFSEAELDSMEADRAARLARLDRLADRLDSQFSVAGIRFGWDSIIGLIPGIGDAATAVPSAWIVYQAYRMGMPTPVLARMAANTGIDFVIGGIPVVGDLFDLGFKANRRNIALLRRRMERDAAARRRTPQARRPQHG
jgi:hypothetical protein